MDIFKPHKNPISIVQQGLPKDVNKHIAEYWCFKKCYKCKQYRHKDFYAQIYIKSCYYCRDVCLEWNIYVSHLNVHEINAVGEICKRINLPAWMRCHRGRGRIALWKLIQMIDELDDFARLHSIPPQFFDYVELDKLLYSP